jgi:hypothetical protein
MTVQKQKKLEEVKNGFNQTAAVVTGAVVGAGMAVAGMIAMKDEKNRDKVKEVFTNVKNKAIDYIEDIQKQTQAKKGEVKEKFVEDKVKIEKAAKAVKNSLNSSK